MSGPAREGAARRTGAAPGAAPATRVWRVAVPSPLRRTFDYLPPDRAGGLEPDPGVRLRVPFGRGTRVGVLLGIGRGSALPLNRLKPVASVLDEAPLIPADLLEFLCWMAEYYHHPAGEVVLGALPTVVRRGGALPADGVRVFRLTAKGAATDPSSLKRAPRQRQLLDALRASPRGLGAQELASLARGWRAPMRALIARGLVESGHRDEHECPAAVLSTPHTLNESQRRAVDAVMAARGGFASFVLNGVTGSGKTEVYIELIHRLATEGRQALVLIPEIGLTPQIVSRFRERLSLPVVVIHSGLSEGERLKAWSAARRGRAGVVIGTRSALFTPLVRPGVFIVDEEQDPSFKQQEGLRYSARDMAVVRARMCGVPVVLGSATPSLETSHNIAAGRYTELALPRRAGEATSPRLEVVDIRGRPLDAGLSEPLFGGLEECLRAGEQAILFINRRGFAPAFICRACGWVAECRRCDANMVFHRQEQVLLCHHCGSRRPAPDACPECESNEFRHRGTGTQRVAETLAARLPGARIRRVDRDSTRRKGSFEALIESMHRGDTDIVVGTQMVAKGHHFPNVTLVGVLDADGGLFGVDFRAAERMSQLLLQVAGRAGRGDKPGRVLIQTHHPDHPLLRALVSSGYADFARNALAERAEASLPPFAHMALLRAEAPRAEACERFLSAARSRGADYAGGVRLLGPVPAPMSRRAGRYRAQLFVESDSRAALHRFLKPWSRELEGLPSGRRVRWSLDVDPQEIV